MVTLFAALEFQMNWELGIQRQLVIVAATTLLCCRGFLGYAFSDEKEVVDYLKELTPRVCLLVVMDGIQAVLSGLCCLVSLR